MNSTICTALRELEHDNEEKSKTCFDKIMHQTIVDDNKYRHEIVDALIEANLSWVHVIDHPFFVRLRDIFVNILQKPVDDLNLLCRIGQLFSRITDHMNDKNTHLFQQLFVNATIIECLTGYLKSLSPTSDENLISGIGYIIDAYRKFQENCPTTRDDPIIAALMMPIVDFVKSAEYKTSFFRLSATQDKLTHFQELILVTCPKYVVLSRREHHQEVETAVAQETLSRSPEILKHFLPFIDHWKAPVTSCILYLIWLCQCGAGERLLSAYSEQHKKILDSVLQIVQGKELWHLANGNSTFSDCSGPASELFCYASLYMYTMSFLPELRQKLKERNITPIILRLTQANFDKTQFHAYRLLAAVLTDDDIKQLANPTQITTVFITYLEKSMVYSTATKRRLENSLLSLKNLIQHDQIKAEFVRQANGLPLLIQCATESRYDPIKAQLRALEILMSLTFNDEVKACLRQNINFVHHMQTLASASNTPYLQKAANGILWRLSSKYEQTEHEFQYDVMISYSHKDKEMCHRIQKVLIANNFRVWIDLEEMHGIMMQAIANAIKQSRCVLICMSDNYYLSPYCQAEAQYAFEKRRDLVPIRVQSGYRADGWLAFLTAGRMHIDFVKMNFDTACVQLVSEVNQNQVHGKHTSVMLPSSNISKEPMVRNKRAVDSYPTDILRWTPTDVHDFLLDKQLNEIVPICQLMDGQTLVELYKMCILNSPVMLQVLRSETKELHFTLLSTNIYLIFLREMKQLVPDETRSNIAYCSLPQYTSLFVILTDLLNITQNIHLPFVLVEIKCTFQTEFTKN